MALLHAARIVYVVRPGRIPLHWVDFMSQWSPFSFLLCMKFKAMILMQTASLLGQPNGELLETVFIREV